jgi:hypothetical protein
MPLCPNPDYSKNTDSERIKTWSNCWGNYTVEMDKVFKGDVFAGEFQNGMLNGLAAYYHLSDNEHKGKKYFGEFKNFVRNGQGIQYAPNGDKFVGDYLDGSVTGSGVVTLVMGDKYIGEFKNGKYHGYGVYIFANGRRQEGTWGYGEFIAETKVSYIQNIEKKEANLVSRLFQIDQSNQTLQQIPIQSTQTSSDNKIGEVFPSDAAKIKCTDLGVKPATERFGKCVFQLTK